MSENQLALWGEVEACVSMFTKQIENMETLDVTVVKQARETAKKLCRSSEPEAKEWLYAEELKLMDKYIDMCLDTWSEKTHTQPAELSIESFLNLYEQFDKCVDMFCEVFLVLNRSYVWLLGQNSNLLFMHWKAFSDKLLSENYIRTLAHVFASCMDPVLRDKLKQKLIALEVYSIEGPFGDSIAEVFYNNATIWVKAKLETCTLAEYVLLAMGYLESVMKEEPKFVNRVKDSIFIDQFLRILDHFSENLALKQSNAQVFQLVHLMNSESVLVPCFIDHLKSIAAIDETNPVMSIWNLSVYADRVISTEFEVSATIFTQGVHDLLTELVREREEKITADILAFVSNALKENKMDNVNSYMSIFKYLPNKDLFVAQYHEMLCSRLLKNRGICMEYEEDVVEQLKTICGHVLVSKLIGALRDWKLAKPTTEDINPSKTEVIVLSKSFWPTIKKTTELVLPDELQQLFEQFSKSYTSKYPSRTLQWNHEIGSVIVEYTVGTKTYTASFNGLQTAVIQTLLNSGPRTVSELQEVTKMSLDFLKCTLFSLTFAKFKLLCSSGEGKSIRETDTFHLNDQFSNPVRRFSVPFPSMQPKKNVIQQVDEDRRFIIDSIIVRCMKARKTMTHNDLIGLVCSDTASQFKIEIPAIKKRIESLIEREFLKRSEETASTYQYLA